MIAARTIALCTTGAGKPNQVRGRIVFQLRPLRRFGLGKFRARPVAKTQRDRIQHILHADRDQLFVFIKKLEAARQEIRVRWIRMRHRIAADKLRPQPVDIAMMRIENRISAASDKLPMSAYGWSGPPVHI